MNRNIFFDLVQDAVNYLDTLPHRPVGVLATRDELLSHVDQVLPEVGEAPGLALDKLAKSVENGLVHSTSPHYFGFVIGGATPVSIAADWLTSMWDQNGQVYNTSPAASIIEDVVTQWLLDMLGLPKDSGMGFVTGAQMANFTALSVAGNTVLQKHGWNIDENGLQGAPQINVVCGEYCHGTIHSAIRLMGLGQKNIRVVQADSEGRIELEAYKTILKSCQGPTIICAQAGNVNTGAFDPFVEIIALAKEREAWVHIDGAFGLWANTSPKFKELISGVSEADSWATDAHKWLNVPYDSGIVIVRDPLVHQGLKTAHCTYAGPITADRRDGSRWVPENSRRARGFVLYASLRNLGRKGVREIIENCCEMAQEFVAQFAQLPYAHVLNKVVLNQVLVRIEPERVKDIDAFNIALASRIQKSGVCWIGTTKWRGQTALRISVSNWSTKKDDVKQAMNSIRSSVDQELAHLATN
jgi:glutamate/tyrosine decarboxylase-like PLP-dependent enzyme